MFTGLVEAMGEVRKAQVDGPGALLEISMPFACEATIGESIAINGACLTVVSKTDTGCLFQAGPETLKRTNLGALQPGDRVNLERSLRLGDRLGGHMVQGHVDGMGTIVDRHRQEDWETVWFRCSTELALQLVSKGSVAIDGVSLTVVDVAENRFSVALIPHTLAATTLGFKDIGATVNLETDILAKYVQKLMQSSRAGR